MHTMAKSYHLCVLIIRKPIPKHSKTLRPDKFTSRSRWVTDILQIYIQVMLVKQNITNKQMLHEVLLTQCPNIYRLVKVIDIIHLTYYTYSTPIKGIIHTFLVTSENELSGKSLYTH